MFKRSTTTWSDLNFWQRLQLNSADEIGRRSASRHFDTIEGINTDTCQVAQISSFRSETKTIQHVRSKNPSTGRSRAR